MRRAVFLDRDGTLNDAIVIDGQPRSPLSVHELKVLPGVGEGLERLRAAGFLPVVITNQPNVPRGVQTRAEVEAINKELGARLGLEHFYVCWHDDADRCECRKPRPGLILSAARELALDLNRSFMIGDRAKDVEAGVAAGCQSILIDHGYAGPDDGGASARVSSFEEAARWIRRWESHGDDGKVARVAVSREKNGKPDTWMYPGPDGKLARAEISSKQDEKAP